MKTRPRRIESRIAAAAPGLRASPSHAAEATLDCAVPESAAAVAIENPEAMAIHIATRSGGFSLAGPWANTGAAIRPITTTSKSIAASFFTSFSFRLLFAAQAVAPGHPSCSREHMERRSRRDEWYWARAMRREM